MMRRFEEAARDFTFVLEVQPDNAAARFFRGIAWMELGRLADARADMMAAQGMGFDLGDPEAQQYLTAVAQEYVVVGDARLPRCL